MNLPPPIPPPPPAIVQRIPDSVYLKVIAEIESGNNDHVTGPHQEVSRFQIKLYVWRKYTHSTRYHDVAQSTFVARRHLSHLRVVLISHAIKETPELIGLIWHYGEEKRKAEDSTELDYSLRFANLTYEYARP